MNVNDRMGVKKKGKDILMIEDNPTDVLLTKEAFKECGLKLNLHVASDGLEGLKFLHREGDFHNAVSPDLILLDLNMPRKSGKEVLEEIKTTPELKHIPVVILSTSTDFNDIKHCYQLGANSYIPKPVDFEDFLQIVKTLEAYWFNVSELPTSK